MPEIRSRFEVMALRLRKWLYNSRKQADAGGSSCLFVAGMQRSGTNLLMETIESDLDTDVYHEYDKRAFDNYQMRDLATIHRLRKKSRARVLVIKSLCELQSLSHMMTVMAPARVVWIVRDHDDVVNSMLRSFRNMAAQIERIVIDRNGSGWIGNGMSDETHELVSRLAYDGIDDANASALQWYIRNILFFDQNFQDNTDVFLTFYEDLVTDPECECQRIFDFAGLHFDSRYVQSISAGSVRKNKAPELMDPIRDVCNDLMERFRSVGSHCG